MLATLKEVLEIANQRETAIPHFNIDNIDGIEAVMEAADTENYPVILSIGQGAINAGNLWYLADAVQRAANDSKVPVVLHLDHGVSYEQTVVCLRAGFTSVIRSAHAVGVSVECELGAIGGVEDGMSHDHLNLVDVGEVERFCAQVDCDALAIGIGNAHGLYKGTPHFDFDRLAACRKLDTPPLVLHGGSGTPDEMLRKAIELGIRKINVATELRMAYMEGLEASVGQRDFYKMCKQAKDNITAVARQKIRLFQGL